MCILEVTGIDFWPGLQLRGRCGRRLNSQHLKQNKTRNLETFEQKTCAAHVYENRPILEGHTESFWK
jgi:hypothetical protein